MYDEFSQDYDRFMNWNVRLAAELPFIQRQLQAVDATSVLDVACGTGQHAIALAQQGYQVTGADPSEPMIGRARANAVAEGVDLRLLVAGFGEMSERAGGPFDAVLCLGNSLPHVLTADALRVALADFKACLRPGGLLLIQNRNFDAVLARAERWMDPQSYREGDAEWLYLRFYDFEPGGTLRFNMVSLSRQDGGDWEQKIMTTRLRPQLRAELEEELVAAGFGDVATFGDMSGAPFEPMDSPNLVLVAEA